MSWNEVMSYYHEGKKEERERCAALVEKHGCTCPFPGHHLESCHVQIAAVIREDLRFTARARVAEDALDAIGRKVLAARVDLAALLLEEEQIREALAAARRAAPQKEGA